MKRLDSRFVAFGILVFALAACGRTSPTSSEPTTETSFALAAGGKAGGGADGKDKITAWVVLKERANLTDVRGIRDWKARGKAVHERLQDAANVHQADLRA